MARDPWEWQEADLLSLIDNQVPEGLTLDYKDCRALGKGDGKSASEASKDVSAFANAQGGAIVYGMLEGPSRYPRSLDVGYDRADNVAEWLEQVINSNVRPRLEGVKVNEVALSSGSTALVVSVPQGRTAHQAADRRYYKRRNFQCLPMEDYEIRDVMRRAEVPDLEVQFELTEPQPRLAYSEGSDLSEPVGIRLLVRNVAERPAEYSLIHLYVPTGLKADAEGFRLTFGAEELDIEKDEQRCTCKHLYRNLMPPSQMPIFKTLTAWSVATLHLRFPRAFAQGSHRLLMGWRAEAPYMDPRGSVYRLIVDFGELVLQD